MIETRLTPMFAIRSDRGMFYLVEGDPNYGTASIRLSRDIVDVRALGRALVAFADAQPTGPLHVVDQSGQPYGSVRRCCNVCGAMVERTTRYVETVDEWRKAEGRCAP